MYLFYSFICIFTPAILSSVILNGLSKKERKPFFIVMSFFVFLLFITLGDLLILNCFFDHGSEFITMESFTNSFSLRYLAISIPQAIIYPILYEVSANVLSFKIDVKQENKGSNRHERKNKNRR